MLAARQLAETDASSLGDFHRLVGAVHVAVAVSGGSDSLALLLLAKQWADERGVTLHALTFDHGLRPESAAEAERVGGICRRHGVHHTILIRKGPAPHSGLQAWGRLARYGAMTAWCRAHDVLFLLTGHTLNDQAETVAMRRQRTSSARSLAGIWPETEMDGVRVIRPLLGVSRDSLRHYLRARGETWIDDPSNTDPRFERVRVREMLAEADVPSLAVVAAQSRDLVEERSRQARDWYDAAVTKHAEGFFSFERHAFLALPADVRTQAIDGLVFALSGHKLKSEDSRQRTLNWLEARGAARCTVGGVVFARRSRDCLMGREFGRIGPPAAIGPDGELLWDHRFVVKGPPGTLVSGRGWQHRMVRAPAFVAASLPHARTPDGTVVEILWEFRPKPDFS